MGARVITSPSSYSLLSNINNNSGDSSSSLSSLLPVSDKKENSNNKGFTRRRRIWFGVPSAALLAFGFFLFRFFGVSVRRVMNFLITMPNYFITSAGILPALKEIGWLASSWVLPFISIALGFALLAMYGRLYGEDKALGAGSALVAVVTGFVLVGISPSSLLFGAGMIIGGALATGYGETFYKELHKWKNYRTGTHAVGNILKIINLLILAALVLNVWSDMGYYEDVSIQETKSMVAGFIVPELPGTEPGGDNDSDTELLSEEEIIQQLPEEQREMLDQLPDQERREFLEQFRSETRAQTEIVVQQQIDSMMDELLQSQNIKNLMDMSLLMMAFAVWGVLEFLRSWVLSPIAGLVTKLGSVAIADAAGAADKK